MENLIVDLIDHVFEALVSKNMAAVFQTFLNLVHEQEKFNLRDNMKSRRLRILNHVHEIIDFAEEYVTEYIEHQGL